MKERVGDREEERVRNKEKRKRKREERERVNESILLTERSRRRYT